MVIISFNFHLICVSIILLSAHKINLAIIFFSSFSIFHIFSYFVFLPTFFCIYYHLIPFHFACVILLEFLHADIIYITFKEPHSTMKKQYASEYSNNLAKLISFLNSTQMKATSETYISNFYKLRKLTWHLLWHHLRAAQYQQQTAATCKFQLLSKFSWTASQFSPQHELPPRQLLETHTPTTYRD